MAARDEKIGEFRAKPSRGKIRESAHIIQRLKRRPGCHNAIHAAILAAKSRKEHKKFFADFVLLGGYKIVFLFFRGRISRVSKIVGIDLGTTNSLVATVDSGIPLVIADAHGQRLTPSVVYFSSADAGAVVGHEANRVRPVKPAETVYSVKRFIGRRGSDISKEEMLVTYPIEGDNAGAVTIPIHGRNFTPEEISAEVLKKLKRDAENYFGEPVTRAVITVPAYFNDAQRNATKRAGELAGFIVERIINEPTAAALAYGLGKLKEKSKIAVYDLGGGTFDLSILELNEGVFQVLATNGNTRLGGDDLDKRIVDFLVEKIKTAGKIEFSLSRLSRIREAAEQSKIKLSTETEVEIMLPFLTPDFSFSYQITRTELENLTRDIIAHTRAHCLRALADAKLEKKDLDQIILVGGQTRMPLVRKFVGELFGCAEFEESRGGLRLGSDFHKAGGPQLNTSQNPDEAVALGAAIQAEILSGGFKNVLLLDVTPLSLGLETFGGLMNVLIPRNSTIPLKAGELFTTAVDNQRSMLIQVLQGERERAKDNWSLGKFTIEFESASRGVPRVGVQFEIDANGILHVLARDTKTGREKIVEMKSAVDVDDATVQQMVEESVEHAFEDLAVRRWIEAKLRANETLAATRKAITDCGNGIENDYREKIESAAREVEIVLAAENSETKIGDVKQLQAAVVALDETTRPLADLLMDKAMEAMLKKRGLIQ
jgi:molecular chaperone DnaK